MKKIAFVANNFREANFKSGGEKLFFELVKKAVEKKFIVDLYCSKYYPDKYLNLNKIIVIGKPTHYKKPELIENIFDQFKLHIEKENYDYVITDSITPPIDILFVQTHSLIYRKKHESFLDSIYLSIKKFKHFLYQKKWANGDYRKIFVVSNVLKKDLIDNLNIPEEKIIVIYPGVDIEKKTNSTFSDILAIKEKRRNVVFGISATSFRYKGGYLFLRALKILKQRNFAFKAKIIYPNHKKNKAVKFIIKLYNLESNIEFLPYQDNMCDFYESIDCMIVPSIIETFGLVVLEAMVNKKPCIVGSYAGASEIVNNGHNGLIFDMKKFADKNLADKMAFIINNPNKLQEYAIKAFEVAKKYSWDRTANCFIEEITRFR